jgi:hypothetical protein
MILHITKSLLNHTKRMGRKCEYIFLIFSKTYFIKNINKQNHINNKTYKQQKLIFLKYFLQLYENKFFFIFSITNILIHF